MDVIWIATTGGDAPGMNAALRAAVRTAAANGLRVIGFERGYAGILANESQPHNNPSARPVWCRIRS